MQIHIANCNLTHPPLQHLPVDESPRAEEMKSVNIVQCSHTMYAKSTKERRNAFCQYPLHTIEIVGQRNANQPSKNRMRRGAQSASCRKPLSSFATLSFCNPQDVHLTPKQKAQKLLSFCQWMWVITCLRVVKSFICVKVLV